MTICIGMIGHNGIVIAADSEENDTYIKKPVQKIVTWGTIKLSPNGDSRGESACVLAGAGDAGFIEAFTQYVLRSVPTNASLMEFEAHLENRLKSFYSKHVTPLLAVGYQSDFQCSLVLTLVGKQHFS